MASEDEKSNGGSQKLKITVCGGGNGAHAFVVTASAKFSPQFEVNWLSLYADEAERINNKLTENDGYIQGKFVQQNALVSGKPNIVTKDPSKVFPDSDIIVLCVPSFGHSFYLKEIAAHNNVCLGKAPKDKKLIIGAIPSGAGLEFAAASILKDNPNVVLVNCVNLPWACRIKEYGRSVEILGVKSAVDCFVSGSGRTLEKTFNPMEKVRSLFIDRLPSLPCDASVNIFSSTLGYINACVHCPIMYRRWRDYDGETEFAEKPLFYHAITKEDAEFMGKLSDEILLIAANITKAGRAKNDQFREIKVQHIKDSYTDMYGDVCPDNSTLFGMITTNPGYNGLTHPMKAGTKDAKKFVPDFNYRYLTEDIPFGLLIMRALALLVKGTEYSVETPVMDEILLWAEAKLNRKYFVKNKDNTVIEDIDLESDDTKKTRIPQMCGFKTIDDILNF